MKNKRIAVRVGAAALTALCLTAGVALASGVGTESDPLITLSYLNTTATPAILEQVDGKVEAYEQQLVDKLNTAIQAYSERMDQAVTKQEGQQHNASYAVVTLKKDQVLNMDIGCEVMLRIGTAVCVAPSSPGLINTTEGTTLNNEKNLVTNHLYMATITGRAIRATANTTKVLVRGGYTVT
ncbi:MAG: hypothetical protein IJB75_07880 [Oscillospiraceae bacterium]|nr:hypothetical protein [Oscillospiraceae bacterium]